MNVVDLILLQNERKLHVKFEDGKSFRFSCEYLRVFSPSAEVRGHDGVVHWPQDKSMVNITAIEPVGLYGVKLYFDDGHHSGIYTFDYFYELMQKFDQNWQEYCQALKDG